MQSTAFRPKQLLRQPGGVEDFSLTWEEGDPRNLAVYHGVERGEGLPHGNGMALPFVFSDPEDQYRAGAEVGSPLRLEILEGSNVVPHRFAELFEAIGQANVEGPNPARVPHHIGIDVLDSASEESPRRNASM